VRSQAALAEGAVVKLRFTPPDGAAPVEVIALVARVGRDRVALSFVYLASAEARRLGEVRDSARAERLQRGGDELGDLGLAVGAREDGGPQTRGERGGGVEAVAAGGLQARRRQHRVEELLV
jgi:hypothetical protein